MREPSKFHPAFSYLLLLSTLSSLTLSGCTSVPLKQDQSIIAQTPAQRTLQMKQLKNWKVTGKIAFIDKKSRNSASLSWAVNERTKTQQLNLTTYMGINVLQLNSRNNLHTIKADGQTYKGGNLEALIMDITGLTLPTNALTYWLKGFPYHDEDKFEYQNSTQLPLSLSSNYNNEKWQIIYGNYQSFDGYVLAKNFTIKKGGFMIKIAINDWTIASY